MNGENVYVMSNSQYSFRCRDEEIKLFHCIKKI